MLFSKIFGDFLHLVAQLTQRFSHTGNQQVRGHAEHIVSLRKGSVGTVFISIQLCTGMFMQHQFTKMKMTEFQSITQIALFSKMQDFFL